MRRLFFSLQLLLFLMHVNISVAQGPRKKYNWEENRKITYQLTDEEAKAHAVTILDSRFIDYTEDDSYTNIELYITRHIIIRVNDDIGIREFNKVYIPVLNQDEIIKLKARTISKEGKIKEINKDDIKLLNVSKEFINYKIFAMDGVEAGSELEYFYTLKRDRRGYYILWGNSFLYGTEIFQGNTKVKEANFTITTPSYLLIDAKSYNGFPNIEINKKTSPVILNASIKDIPAMPEEIYATTKADCMKVSYKINHNKKVPYDNNLLTWKGVISIYYNDLFRNFYPLGIPGDLKTDGLGQDEKIRAIENYIKKNVAFKIGIDDALFTPHQVLKNRLGNYWGIVSLYAAFFKALNIPFNLVITCNRYEATFDPDFTDFDNFRDMLFYFPETKKYVCPHYMEYRYGPAPFELANNYATFIESEEKGHLGIIPFMDVNHNKYRLNATVVIDSNMEALKVNKVQTWEGYRAIKIRGAYNEIKEEQRANFLSYLALDSIITGKITDQKVTNTRLDNSDVNEPLTINTSFISSSLIEHAGDNYLLNVGLLIGKQSELYQKEKRESDIEMEFPSQSIRTIYLQIPKGYRVKGLEDANIDKAFMEKDQRACQFVSSYTLGDDGVVINVNEYYTTTSYPKERYEEFRQVVNAAADFNKLQLVLEKE